MLSHQAFVLVLSRIIQIFHRAIVISYKVWRTSTLFPSPFWFLRNKALPITNKKTAWTSNRTRRLSATAINADHQYNYDFGLLWIAGSAILIIPQTHNIAGEKISRFESRKSVYTAKLSGFKSFRIQSSHFRFRIQNLRRHDQTEMILFRIRPLVCNDKTNPVLKRSGFITNLEQFPLV